MSKLNSVPAVMQHKRVVTVNEAIEITEIGKFNYKMMGLTSLMCVALVLESTGFSYIIPASQCDLELDMDTKGVVAAIPFICMIVTSHTWGYMADTKGRRISLAIALAVGSVISILSSFSPNLITFVILRVFSGLFTAGSNAVIYAYIGEFLPQRFLDRFTSVLSSCIVFASAGTSVLAWVILPCDFRPYIAFLNIEFRPWRLLVLVYAIPAGICAAFLFASFETPKFLTSKGKTKEALEVLQSMYSDNTGNPKSSFPVDVVIRNKDDIDISGNTTFMGTVRTQTLPLFMRPYIVNLSKIFIIQFCILISGNGLYFWLPEIFNRFIQGYATGEVSGMNVCDLITLKVMPNETEYNNTMNGAICKDTIEMETFPFVIGVSIVISLYNMVVAFVVKYSGKRTMLLVNFGVTVLIGIMINFIYDPIAGLVMFVAFNLTGTMLGICNAFSIELFPTHLRGMAVCLALMFGRIGSVTGTNLVGQLIENNCSLTFYIFSGTALCSFITAWFLPDGKTKEIEQTKF